MVTINGIKFRGTPSCCNWCPALAIHKNDNRGRCVFFDKEKNRYDGIPKRCRELFDKAFTYSAGTDLVIVLKD